MLCLKVRKRFDKEEQYARAARHLWRKKTRYEGKSAGTGFITPLILHNDTIHIAGQGAHSHDPKGEFPMDIETHTKKVMDNVKTSIETGGGTMAMLPPTLVRRPARS